MSIPLPCSALLVSQRASLCAVIVRSTSLLIGLCNCTGVDGLSRKIQEVKDFVDERVDALSRKQDSLADSQDEMKDQLEDVQHNIQGVSCSCLQTKAAASACGRHGLPDCQMASNSLSLHAPCEHCSIMFVSQSHQQKLARQSLQLLCACCC